MTKLIDYTDPDATVRRPAIPRKQFRKPDMTRQSTVLVPAIARGFYASQFETLYVEVIQMPPTSHYKPVQKRHTIPAVMLSVMLALSIIAIVTMTVLLKFLYFTR